MFKIISKKHYEYLVSQASYWRKQSKFTLNIPYMTIDGIGEVQIYCKDEAEAKKIADRLRGGTLNKRQRND